MAAAKRSRDRPALRSAGANAAGKAAFLISNANLSAAIALLRGTGTQGAISTQKAEYVFTSENAIYAKLQAKLSGA